MTNAEITLLQFDKIVMRNYYNLMKSVIITNTWILFVLYHRKKNETECHKWKYIVRLRGSPQAKTDTGAQPDGVERTQ